MNVLGVVACCLPSANFVHWRLGVQLYAGRRD